MKEHDEKIPDPKEIEKEIGDFLAKKFGGTVKMVSPLVLPQEAVTEKAEVPSQKKPKINFDLKPEELIAYLDQYIVKQDTAKAILATKICTHFNRIKRAESSPDNVKDMVGSIKNNILMFGPTGVGKTYIIKLIAKKIRVPFVKGDATKFSETGYVGGDVEDLVRDLVREADGDIELAQYGIIYIDEIDKIASSRNIIGVDVSRSGVQRALLKPMEETEVDLKVPHDPISMIQEIERFRKTGKREKRAVNTNNILFIMSGAFGDLAQIVKKRIAHQEIGFSAQIRTARDDIEFLKHVKSEDLIEFGFESEFVGRLTVRAVFEKLTEDDLYDILKNPSNPIILGKKLDFAAYGIDIKFEDKALRRLAQNAYSENTGARGLVSAVEGALLLFEKKLPSTHIKKIPVTAAVIENPGRELETLLASTSQQSLHEIFEKLTLAEKEFIKDYLNLNKKNFAEKYSLTLTPSRIDIVADYYVKHIMDMGKVIDKIKSYYDEIKKIELYFFKKHDINIVMEEDAIDFVIDQFENSAANFDDFYKKLSADFEYGLKLVREKTGRNRFFITKQALLSPEAFISNLIRAELRTN
ncbi:MAG: AAA family ATPase [Desulfobacterales bacterium]|uniref:AAA family ATPase n=1 Tax=Candidatus Desulfatibia profunda TaxID=2841695 RepID=A0A8J6NTK7_9BACT|nr:AAA family ATPase [Candidatus Desulfatibia profunda]MBL7180286.1 AAA family ATPase [Desulfobacterales bacterium]MBU0698254.1 AAA family ATPase [Pseudomonadota bacterium]